MDATNSLTTAALHPMMATSQAAGRRASCLGCAARPSTVCAAVPTPEIERVALIKSPSRRLPAGAMIYAEQERCVECFTVLSGWVALTAALEDGRRMVLDFQLPGDYFGFQANPAVPRGHGAVAVTAVRLCPLPRSRMLPLLAADPALSKHLSHLVALHEARAQDRLVNNTVRDARGRVARLLVELYFRQNHRLPHEPGQVVDLPLTLALVGDALGVSEEHISRSLRSLREEGIIRLHRGQLRICAPDALVRLSGAADRPLADMATPVA